MSQIFHLLCWICGRTTYRLDRRLWRALEDANSYAEWEAAAEALNADDPRLVKWKAQPEGPYSWDVILQRCDTGPLMSGGGINADSCSYPTAPRSFGRPRNGGERRNIAMLPRIESC